MDHWGLKELHSVMISVIYCQSPGDCVPTISIQRRYESEYYDEKTNPAQENSDPHYIETLLNKSKAPIKARQNALDFECCIKYRDRRDESS